MKPVIAIMIALAVPCAVALAQQSKVEVKGLNAPVKFEQVLSGPLSDINSKYKIRVSEGHLAPGGYVREHQHLGPGVRVLIEGELTFTQQGKTTVYKAGEAFFESGDITTAVENKSDQPMTLLNFEILPVALSGSSTILPPK